MSATNQFEVDLLTLIFNNTNAPNIGDATGLLASTTPGSFYLSLHTAALSDVTTAQNTTEATYTSYARVGVARNAGGWTVSAGAVENTAEVAFPACTGGSNTLTYLGIGSTVSGVGYLQIWAALGASLAVSTGITPRFIPGALDITLD